jgi:hypothetical protein
MVRKRGSCGKWGRLSRVGGMMGCDYAEKVSIIRTDLCTKKTMMSLDSKYEG